MSKSLKNNYKDKSFNNNNILPWPILVLKALITSLIFNLVIITLIVIFNSVNAEENIYIKKIDDVNHGSLLVQKGLLDKNSKVQKTIISSKGYTSLPLLNTSVDIRITGLTSITKVKQTFTNNTDYTLEATYVFPLPENAVVEAFKFIIGDEIIEGKVMEKNQAKQTYLKAKKEDKSVALMLQHRPNIFKTHLANIPKETQVSVVINYRRQIDYSADGYQLKFPLVVGPRYQPKQTKLSYQAEKNAISPQFKQEILNKKVTNIDYLNLLNDVIYQQLSYEIKDNYYPISSEEIDKLIFLDKAPVQIAKQENKTIDQFNNYLSNYSRKQNLNPVQINVILDAGFTLQKISSPSHGIRIQQNKEQQTQYKINLSDQAIANKDFILQWQVKPSQYPQVAIFNEADIHSSEDVFINMMIMPPKELFNTSQRLSKEMIIVLDTSGSMQGTSIIQAKQAVNKLLRHMHSEDSFNIIEFNNIYSSLFPIARKADEQNTMLALNYIKKLNANGGTEMAKPLQQSFNQDYRQTSTTHQVRQVIFITDGNISNENELFSIIENERQDSKLFTVGIGSAPNDYFMRKAAEVGHGSFTSISNINEVEDKMNHLFKQIDSPLLTGLTITWPKSFSNIDVYPKNLNDLYLGQAMLINAKVTRNNITKQNKDKIILEAESHSGHWINTLIVGKNKSTPKAVQKDSNNTGLSKLWANKKISALMDNYRQINTSRRLNYEKDGASEKDIIKNKIIELSIKHQVLSFFTSFIAVSNKKIVTDNSTMKTTDFPLNTPAGHSLSIYPSTATIAPWLNYVGYLSLMLGTLLLSFKKIIVSIIDAVKL